MIEGPPGDSVVSAADAAWPDAPARLVVDTADLDVVFRRQPRPVAARHRLAYRTALVVLVLSHFNQDAAKLTNLHTLMWATRSARTRHMFTAWWAGRRYYFISTDRIDPDLQVTLNLALVDGLVQPLSNRNRIQLTGKGRDLAARIGSDEGLLTVEKAFLGQLDRLSDGAMERRLSEVRT